MYKPISKIILLLLLPVFIPLINSCRRNEINLTATKTQWTIDDAKEWWYGIFKKQPAYKETDIASPYAISLKQASGKYSAAANMPKNIKKYPVWEMGRNYSTGNYAIVEFPLLYPVKLSVLPQAGMLNEGQKRKIAECILNRVVMIRTPGGQIEVRTISIIPEYNYASSKQFDISDNSMQHFEKNFKGWVIIRQWNEKIINIYEAANGKITGKLKMQRSLPKPKDAAPGMARMACEYQMMEVWEKVCIEGPCDPPQDVPCVTDCADWFYAPSITWEWVCVDVDDNACLQSILPYDQCMCTYYGLYCDGGSNEGNTETKIPCAIADSLENDTWLRNWCDSARSSISLRRERSTYLVHQNGNYLSALDTTGIADSLGAPDINLATGVKLDGLTHNHFFREGVSLNTYTPLDLFSLGKMLLNGNIRSVYSFVFFLTTPYNSTASPNDYSLVISDSSKFANYITPSANLANGHYLLELEYTRFRINETNNYETNEKNMLNFLSQSNTGLTLLKRKESNGIEKWEPLTLQNDQVTSIPCN